MADDGETYPPVIAEFLGDISDLAAKAQEATAIVQAYEDQANSLGATSLAAEELAPAPEEVEESGLSTGQDLGHAIAQGESEALAETDTSAGAAAAAQELGATLTPAVRAEGLAAGAEAANAMGQGLSAGSAAAGRAAAPQLGAVLDQVVNQAAAAGERAGREFTTRLSDTVGQDLNDEEYDQFLMELAQAAGGQDAVDSLAASWERMAGAEDDAAAETEKAGTAAADASVHWLALGLAAAAVEFGIGAGVLGLSTAILGAGYLIADFGGEAKGDLQQVEGAFRSSAEQASQSYSGATQSITADLTGLARNVEPAMAEMFQELSGPAEEFFSGLATSAEAGMDALVPAIGQMAPLISSISGDLEPLLTGVAGAVQQMAAAFEAGGGQQELATLAQDIGQLLPVVGELGGEIGSGLLPIAIALTPPLQALGDILNALGPGFTTAAAGAYLAYQGWNQLSNISDSLIKGYTSLSDWISRVEEAQATQAGTSEAAAAAEADEAAAAGAATLATEAETVALEEEAVAAGEAAIATEAAGAAMAEEAVEAAAAGFALGDMAAAALPLIAVAGALFLAGDEIVQHWSGVSSFFGQMASDAGQWGQDIGNGFVGGVETAWDNSVGAVENLGTNLSNGFKNIMGISSPSTVFQGYGHDTADGATLGIISGTPGAVAASSALAQAVASGYGNGLGGFGSSGLSGGFALGSAPSSGGSGSGDIIINLTLQVTQPLATPTDIANAVIPALQGSNLLNGISMAAHSGLKGGPGR